jgi:hypothetical protein
MVSQLRQMGFTDMREMLAGIRHVSSPTDLQSQVDAAMMWIVVRDYSVHVLVLLYCVLTSLFCK